MADLEDTTFAYDRLSHAISRVRAAHVMQKNHTQLSSFNIADT